MEGTKYQVRVDSTGLKQGDALSPLLFNLALEIVVRMMQSETNGIVVNKHLV